MSPKNALRILVPLWLFNTRPWRVTTILSGCLVLRAEARLDLDAMEYVACRGDFPLTFGGDSILTVWIGEDGEGDISHYMNQWR